MHWDYTHTHRSRYAAAVNKLVLCCVCECVHVCVCVGVRPGARTSRRRLLASRARFRNSFVRRDLKSEGGFVVRVQSVLRSVCVRVVSVVGCRIVSRVFLAVRRSLRIYTRRTPPRIPSNTDPLPLRSHFGCDPPAPQPTDLHHERHKDVSELDARAGALCARRLRRRYAT